MDWFDCAVLSVMIFALINLIVIFTEIKQKKRIEAESFIEQGYSITVNGEKIMQLPESLTGYRVHYNHDDQVIVMVTS